MADERVPLPMALDELFRRISVLETHTNSIQTDVVRLNNYVQPPNEEGLPYKQQLQYSAFESKSECNPAQMNALKELGYQAAKSVNDVVSSTLSGKSTLTLTNGKKKKSKKKSVR